ncbi:MAG: hypothetical protein H5U08_18115 [Thermogutta sp.]|uniref:hypothetical protein n=1 Tax=Thermogutta sp. TaxID=1962930 RepID=UPI00199CA898|nr:hypothetical protein [Thermogutta sp.]MBC7354276.1 hypothetical protein [Thermogutta sp.]
MSPRRPRQKTNPTKRSDPTSAEGASTPVTTGANQKDSPSADHKSAEQPNSTILLPDQPAVAERDLDAVKLRAAEWLLAFARQKLLAQEEELALAGKAFLVSAGVNWEAVELLSIGVLGSLEECFEAYRKTGHTDRPALEYWLKDRRVENSLIGPIHNAAGVLVTLWARPLRQRTPGWLFRHAWQDTLGFFGVEVLASARPPHVLAVERLLDALALRSHGVHPVVAFGAPFDRVPPERWSELLRWGVVQATLLPVGPAASIGVFHNLRKRLRGLGRCPELWVLPPQRLTLPLGRFVAQVGGEEFLNLVRARRVALLGRKQLFLVGSVPGRREWRRASQKTEVAADQPGPRDTASAVREGRCAEANRNPSRKPPSQDEDLANRQRPHTPSTAEWLDFD